MSEHTDASTPVLNLSGQRARQARYRHYIGLVGEKLLLTSTLLITILGTYCFVLTTYQQAGFALLASATLLCMVILWYSYGLKHLPVRRAGTQLDDIMEAELLARCRPHMSPRTLWNAASKTVEGSFILNRLLLDPKAAATVLDGEGSLAEIWEQSLALSKDGTLHGGTIIAAIIKKTPAIQTVLTQNNVHPSDIDALVAWLDRQIAYSDRPTTTTGGIGHDWASGFTPMLERFSQNLSQNVQARGGSAYYLAHDDLLAGISDSLAHNSGVALVGPDGVGKSTMVYSLAQQLIQGNEPGLRYYQVHSLDAARIISQGNTQLERLMLTLFGEAIAAGNIVLFLDNAELFFGNGVGAFDMGQILLPVLQNQNCKIITAFTPNGWQQLQAKQPALANLLNSVTVQEPDEAATYAIVEDTALILEHRHDTLISFEAIREAYRLSGNYMQDQAYPGKTIRLLEQAMPYANHRVLTAESIQAAIEKTKGVKVSAAQAPEADMLLHLEERIHERMIDQQQAVSAVAAALRRGRAGVADPKRPVGSFLFLGPTGVGKTELARSLAATYFGNEHNMIRLDMSEYQRPSDTARLLSAEQGGTATNSLLLAIRKQPFSVVLLDEVEKAHPDILNLLLQLLDEGQLTDQQGRVASFRNAIIIATSNAGATEIAHQVGTGNSLANFERTLVDKLIAEGQFKPELINRFDEIVLFKPLSKSELAQIAHIMLQEVNHTLATQQITVALTSDALQYVIQQGYDPVFGARPMRRVIQRTVENAVANKILRQEIKPGDTVTLDQSALNQQTAPTP